MGFGASILCVLALAALAPSRGAGGQRRAAMATRAMQVEKIHSLISHLAPYIKPEETPYKMDVTKGTRIHDLLTKVESRIHVEEENIGSRYQSLVAKATAKRQALYLAAEKRVARAQQNMTRTEAKMDKLNELMKGAVAASDDVQRGVDRAAGKVNVARAEKARLDRESRLAVGSMARSKMADLKTQLAAMKKHLGVIQSVRNVIKIFAHSKRFTPLPDSKDDVSDFEFNPEELRDVAESTCTRARVCVCVWSEE